MSTAFLLPIITTPRLELAKKREREAMADLVLYEAARTALAKAKSVDEVKKVLNEAAAIAAYSKIAKDRTLEADAVEIRKRAERRLGEMMAAQPKAKGGQPHQKKKSKS